MGKGRRQSNRTARPFFYLNVEYHTESVAFPSHGHLMPVSVQGADMGTPTEFHEHALQCIELAKQTNNAVHREMLVGLAAQWLRLAGVTRREIELTRDADARSAA